MSDNLGSKMVSFPDREALNAAADSTWSAEKQWAEGGWIIRDGRGGGKRVSAATQVDAAAGIEMAERAMLALDQTSLFMIRDAEQALDDQLAARGYKIIDPVTIYVAPSADVAEHAPDGLRTATSDYRLAALENIWREDGIDDGRFAVMDRVSVPKTYLMGRHENSPVAAGFVACDGDIAMLHALVVCADARRSGLGRAMTGAAARWAHQQGATFLALMTTDANVAANSLYQRLGMKAAGHYHYRIAPK